MQTKGSLLLVGMCRKRVTGSLVVKVLNCGSSPTCRGDLDLFWVYFSPTSKNSVEGFPLCPLEGKLVSYESWAVSQE